jgi:hypothetical protein
LNDAFLQLGYCHTMADIEFAQFYQEIYGKPLAEPEADQDVKNILSCIRAQHGFFDDNDENDLRTISPILQKKIQMVASKSRKVLAQFTTTISSQLYDDPFRFFYELIQNGDDAKYDRCKDLPTMTFNVYPEELIVDLNEDGFELQDVLSISDTGQSSKKLDEEATGEKGFGFKAVFGIADEVHIQSGLWTFRFEHRRDQDGMGMITPIWQERDDLPQNVRTRFRLRYATTEHDSLETRQHIWKQLEKQHSSLLFALRKLKKISILFNAVEGRNQTITFMKSSNSSEVTITSAVSGTVTPRYYRKFSWRVSDLPRQRDRGRTTAETLLGFLLTTCMMDHRLIVTISPCLLTCR